MLGEASGFGIRMIVGMYMENVRLNCAPIQDYLEFIEPDSVDMILTDPPYDKGALPLYETMGEAAAYALKKGGDLIYMTSGAWLPDCMRLVEEGGAGTLRWNWMLSVRMSQSMSILNRGVFVDVKPMPWYRKESLKHTKWIGNLIPAGKKDKRYHAWGQAVSELNLIIDKLTDENALIWDPFLGGGTTAVAAKELGRQFIGSDIDPECVKITQRRLNEALIIV